MADDEKRYCYSCWKNVSVEWQRFSDLEYGDGWSMDVEIYYCAECGEIFETSNA